MKIVSIRIFRIQFQNYHIIIMITQIQSIEDPISFEKILKKYEPNQKDLELIQKIKKHKERSIQKKCDHNNINGTYKIPIQRKFSNISMSESVRSLDYQQSQNINSQRKKSNKQYISSKNKIFPETFMQRRMIKQNSNQRKILALKKVKKLNETFEKQNTQNKILKNISNGKLFRKEIYLCTDKTPLRQHNLQFNLNTPKQVQKNIKNYHSIESKSLEKKNNIERSIQKLKITNSIKGNNQINHSNNQFKSIKRSIKSVSVISKKMQLTKSRTQINTNSQQFCKFQKQDYTDKQNCCFPQVEKKCIKTKVVPKGNKVFLIQKRQIKIITSKKQKKNNKLANESIQNQHSFLNKYIKKTENNISNNQISPFSVTFL